MTGYCLALRELRPVLLFPAVRPENFCRNLKITKFVIIYQNGDTTGIHTVK